MRRLTPKTPERTGTLLQDEVTIVDGPPQLASRGKWRIVLASLLFVGVIGAVWGTIEQQRKGETSKSIVTMQNIVPAWCPTFPGEIPRRNSTGTESSQAMNGADKASGLS